ncbi:GAP family protein [Flavobacteriaceae bacterium]|nr:GAP family protein [Flavobacteriaceae bacterium]
MNSATIIPLAFTVMLGPQLTVAVLLLTKRHPVRFSIYYILGIGFGIITLTYLSFEILSHIHLKKPDGFITKVATSLILVLLLYLSASNFRNRKKLTTRPKWMQALDRVNYRTTFLMGFGLILFMPADIGAALTVGNILAATHSTFTSAFPFFLAVILIAATPLFTYLALSKKGPKLMEKINQWINLNGWVINQLVYLLFIYLILA